MRPTTTWAPGAVLALAIVGATGCGSQIGTEDAFGCEVISTEPVGDTTPDGFDVSPTAARNAVVGSFSGTITLEDESTVDLILTVSSDADMEVQRREATGGDEFIEPAADPLGCGDVYALDATVKLAAGTALDETVDTTILITTDGTGSFGAQIDQDDLVGDAEPFQLDTTDLAKVTFNVNGTLVGDGWGGSLGFTGETEPSGTGDDAVVSAAFDPWGTFETVQLP